MAPLKTHRQEFLDIAMSVGFLVEDTGLLLTKKLKEGVFLLLVEVNDTTKYLISIWHHTDYDGMPIWEGNSLWDAVHQFEHFEYEDRETGQKTS